MLEYFPLFWNSDLSSDSIRFFVLAPLSFFVFTWSKAREENALFWLFLCFFLVVFCWFGVCFVVFFWGGVVFGCVRFLFLFPLIPFALHLN